MQTQRKAEQTEARRERVPVSGQRTKLQLSERDQAHFEKEGYKVRWFNDQHGRLEAAEAGYWEYVHRDEVSSIGQGAVHRDNSDLGSRVSVVVSKGEPIIRSYLMKIKVEYWKEDQKTKHDQTMEVDLAMQAIQDGGQTIEKGYTPK